MSFNNNFPGNKDDETFDNVWIKQLIKDTIISYSMVSKQTYYIIKAEQKMCTSLRPNQIN